MSRTGEAIILAGGIGSRLKSVSGDIPKPMMPVGGRPFLEYLLAMLDAAGIARVTLSVGYRHEVIRSHFGTKFNKTALSYSIEDHPLGTGGALAQAIRSTKSEYLAILNGDSYFNVDIKGFFKYHIANGADISIAVKHLPDCGRFGAVTMRDGRITAFNEKSVSGSGYINGGMYIVNRRVFDAELPADPFSFEADFLSKMTGSLSILPFISEGYFIDIGTPEDYRRGEIELPALLDTTT